MNTTESQTRAIADMINQYVSSRKVANRPVSTAQALRALRTLMPDCVLSDRELSDMVASSAIKHGRSVSFDAPSSGQTAA